IFDRVGNFLTPQNNSFAVSVIEEIRLNVKIAIQGNFNLDGLLDLHAKLHKLCDGKANIFKIENKYQIQLCFSSEAALAAELKNLNKQFDKFDLLIDAEQFISDPDGPIILQLNADQSIALLSLDPNIKNECDDGRKILANLSMLAF